MSSDRIHRKFQFSDEHDFDPFSSYGWANVVYRLKTMSSGASQRSNKIKTEPKKINCLIKDTMCAPRKREEGEICYLTKLPTHKLSLVNSVRSRQSDFVTASHRYFDPLSINRNRSPLNIGLNARFYRRFTIRRMFTGNANAANMRPSQ